MKAPKTAFSLLFSFSFEVFPDTRKRRGPSVVAMVLARLPAVVGVLVLEGLYWWNTRNSSQAKSP